VLVDHVACVSPLSPPMKRHYRMPSSAAKVVNRPTRRQRYRRPDAIDRVVAARSKIVSLITGPGASDLFNSCAFRILPLHGFAAVQTITGNLLSS